MRSLKSTGGFTLMEVMMALAFFMVVSAMSLAVVSSAVPTIRVNSQINRLLGLLQLAREEAIAKQRDVLLTFDEDTSTIQIVRLVAGQEVWVQTVTFEYGVKFMRFDGTGDTPDGYGAASNIDFNGATQTLFISDGSLVDEASIPVNGTIYIGIDGHPETGRAITITGSTARARFYEWAPGSSLWETGWVGK